jgi:hypothetical protein
VHCWVGDSAHSRVRDGPCVVCDLWSVINVLLRVLTHASPPVRTRTPPPHHHARTSTCARTLAARAHLPAPPQEIQLSPHGRGSFDQCDDYKRWRRWCFSSVLWAVREDACAMGSWLRPKNLKRSIQYPRSCWRGYCPRWSHPWARLRALCYHHMTPSLR